MTPFVFSFLLAGRALAVPVPELPSAAARPQAAPSAAPIPAALVAASKPAVPSPGAATPVAPAAALTVAPALAAPAASLEGVAVAPELFDGILRHGGHPVGPGLLGVSDGVRVRIARRDGRVVETLGLQEAVARKDRHFHESLFGPPGEPAAPEQARRGWSRALARLFRRRSVRPPMDLSLSELTRVIAERDGWKALLEPFYRKRYEPGPDDDGVARAWRALAAGDDAGVERAVAELAASGRLVHRHWVSRADADDNEPVPGHGKAIYTIYGLERELDDALAAAGLGALPRSHASVLTWPIENVQQHVLRRGGRALLLVLRGEAAPGEDVPMTLHVLDSGPGFPVLAAFNEQYHDPKFHERGEALGYMFDAGPRSWLVSSLGREFEPRVSGPRREFGPRWEDLRVAGRDRPADTPARGAWFRLSWPDSGR